ncbi:MAG: helix-turn-helix domain-containing protein, partial [Acidimicrobiia bacterium]|nr:helix-turn-helix domain-containing protein [Acidimicrobiia bacterium]
MGVEFRVLGPLEVMNGGPIELTRPARRRLLSIFLLERGREQSVSRLIDCMWGDDLPGDPRNALQAHIAGLRSQLGEVIHSTPHGYRLDVARLDVDEFERLAGLDDDEPTEQIRCAGEALA